jgi:hypothetical protein
MTRRLLLIAAIVLSGHVAAGQTTKDQTSTTPPGTPPQSASSPTAVAPTRGPLVGEYVGILMCVDCNAVRAKLTLYSSSPLSSSEGTYLFEQSYLSGHGIEQTLTFGQWRALHGSRDDANATVYQLTSSDPTAAPQYFLRISDDTLRLLDKQRRELPSVINTTLSRLPRPGGYVAVDPYDPGVQQAAAFAVAMWSARSPEPLMLRAITRAQRQVFDGANYKLCLDVDVAQTRQLVQSVVYRDSAQTLHLTQWLADGCESRTLR